LPQKSSILHSGKSRSGQANNQFFLYVASVGLTADTVSAVETFRNSTFGSFLFRLLGGFTIYVLTFLTVIPGKCLLSRLRAAPSSRAWIRTCADPARQDFALFPGLWPTIVHYRTMLMPGSFLPKWKSRYSSVTADEFQIEHDHPFSWQVDGVPQNKTRSLKIGFHYRTMRVQTIRQEWD
jgi:diacylglycerol kinase family enzyme